MPRPSFGRSLLLAAFAFTGALCRSTPSAADLPSVVFETQFESGLPAEFSAPGSVIEPVQGYAGLGSPGHTFGGNFLRYTLQGIVDTRLTLRNLPPHSAVDVSFLLGVIDSWDGTELFKVAVDDTVRFSHWFQLATGDASSYVAPPGALLSSGVNLGFSNGAYYFRDRAYDLTFEPAFQHIPHTADSLVVTWSLGAVSGGAAAQWQGGGDESWAIDGVRVAVYPQGLTGADPPTSSRLFLATPSPNPASIASGFTARLTLATSEPARLEWFDARGRRLATRDLGGLGPGTHSVAMVPAEKGSPGVSFLRLTQGPAVRVARVVLLK